jgi:hypothetical protein
VTSFGDAVFGECGNLTNIAVNAANPSYASAGGVLFNKAASVLIEYPDGLKGSYTISNSVMSIGGDAFFGCTNLTSVTIPDSVTNIGIGAFEACSRLTSFIIPDSVTDIGELAFDDCTSLTNVSIGNSVTNIGEEAFDDCTSLTNVVIGNSVADIGEEAFDNCTSLASVSIPNSVTSIGEGAFYDCTHLASVTIPDSVTNIGIQVFSICTSLTNINVDAANSFYSSTNGVLFDKNQTTLIQFPCGLGGSYAIPESVTNISKYAFYGCTSLTSVTIPDSVTNIGVEAFDGCSSLASAVIGSGLTNISNTYMFLQCGNLTSVTFLGNAPTANSTVFSGDTKVTVYYTPGTTGWATFASTTGVPIAPTFGSTTYGGYPVIFYPTTGATNILQMSTNPASGNWVTVSNAVTLVSLQLTNPPAAGFFRLQSSGDSAPNAGLVFYGNLPVLFYPTNSDYTPQMSTNLAAPDWTAPPAGNAFITVQLTNAPPGAVFRLH